MTLHLLISGKVQGVFFRADSKEVAKNLGVKGWITNTPDEKVEAVVRGTEEQVKQFVEWCKQGPPRAKVTDVKVDELPEENFDEFKVIR